MFLVTRLYLQLLDDDDEENKLIEWVDRLRVRPALEDDSGVVSIFRRKCGKLCLSFKHILPYQVSASVLQWWISWVPLGCDCR